MGRFGGGNHNPGASSDNEVGIMITTCINFTGPYQVCIETEPKLRE